jgi:hypothetical protein
MLLVVLTLAVMAAVAYAYLREGLFTAFAMCCNVFFSGLVAFNFWEPIANFLEPTLANTFLKGCEDYFCLLLLFCITLGALRTLSNALANVQIDFPLPLQRGGAAFFGLATGYLTCGFLLCAMQTLPWYEHFMGFSSEYRAEDGLRRFIPPDRVWLSLMYRAGAFAFSNNVDEAPNPQGVSGMEENYYKYYTFDRSATFELRYQKYRRYGDTRDPANYLGDLDEDIKFKRR